MKVVRLLNRYMYWRNKYFTTLRSRVHVYLQIIKIKCCWKNLHIIMCIWTFELFALIIYNWIVSTVLPSNLNMEKNSTYSLVRVSILSCCRRVCKTCIYTFFLYFLLLGVQVWSACENTVQGDRGEYVKSHKLAGDFVDCFIIGPNS